MGNILAVPVTTKVSAACQSPVLKVGSSCMQGWRRSMEDAHTHILNLPDDPEAAFFAVYDGHGGTFTDDGTAVAKHARNILHKCIVQRQEYQSGDIATAIRQGFLQFDSSMMRDGKIKAEAVGSTAVVVLIKNGQIYCGNLGDSRAVACVNGMAHPLSSDHKPKNRIEALRIKNAGGFIKNNRVNGSLALSRSMGDFKYKRNSSKSAVEQIVIALPDVEQRTLNEDWEFVVLASDGIWDCISNVRAVNFIRRELKNQSEPERVCEDLITLCLSTNPQMSNGIGTDNMTVILLCFLHGKTWEEYCSRLSTTVTVTIEADDDNSNPGLVTESVSNVTDHTRLEETAEPDPLLPFAEGNFVSSSSKKSINRAQYKEAEGSEKKSIEEEQKDLAPQKNSRKRPRKTEGNVEGSQPEAVIEVENMIGNEKGGVSEPPEMPVTRVRLMRRRK